MSVNETSTTARHASLEADSADLKAYVDRRLIGDQAEPSWFAAAFDASWPLALAEAAAWDAER